MGATSSSQTVSTRLRRIAEQVVQYPEMVFTTLAHHVDVEFLREAFKVSSQGILERTRRGGGSWAIRRVDFYK